MSCAGVPASSDIILHNSFVSIATWLNAQDASTAADSSTGPADMDIDSPAAESGPEAVPSSPDQAAAQEQIIKKVMQEFIFHSRAEVSTPA